MSIRASFTKWVNRTKDHPLVAALLLVAAIVGAVETATGDILDFMKRFRGDPELRDSINVNLPAGMTFETAARFLASDAKAAVSLGAKCPTELLNAPVAPGPMQGASAVDLVRQLRYRLPTTPQQINYNVNVPIEGVYEVECE
jgi:hypothetical protein